ncbi:MAG TPA: serine/threonine-protein kinase, partial [Polyangiaceae bacterium]|nr:serine/threonine-protein kinase [Polyangiaceae bacterium]
MPPMFAVDDWVSSEQWTADHALTDGLVPVAGTVIDRSYRILRLLGQGAMGAVFLARDETLDRQVAIKFTHPNRLTESSRKRFLDEARAMARVNHPNVVQVYAFGESEDRPYFVMEFVEGQTLEQWLNDHTAPADVDVALGILDAMCLGVAAIHAENTVHHDIKPSNILLDDQRRPRVADLGLAALRQLEPSNQSEAVGTPVYMAPEIAFSSHADPLLRSRADVYSLACVAYQLLTGRPPFEGTTNVNVLLQHASMPVPLPSSLRPGLPEELDRALLHALEKDPAARTPSVEAFRRDLASARRGSLEPKRILIAEDHEDSREALKLSLAHGFPNAEIECVSNGTSALEAFDRTPPSVTILDLRMPGIDGLDLTKLLRERRSSANMPIIVLTASGGPQEWRMLA